MQNSWYLQENQTHHFLCTCGQHDKIENIETNPKLDFEMDDFKRDEIELMSIPNFYHPDNQCSLCNNEKYGRASQIS